MQNIFNQRTKTKTIVGNRMAEKKVHIVCPNNGELI